MAVSNSFVLFMQGRVKHLGDKRNVHTHLIVVGIEYTQTAPAQTEWM